MKGDFPLLSTQGDSLQRHHVAKLIHLHILSQLMEHVGNRLKGVHPALGTNRLGRRKGFGAVVCPGVDHDSTQPTNRPDSRIGFRLVIAAEENHPADGILGIQFKA